MYPWVQATTAILLMCILWSASHNLYVCLLIINSCLANRDVEPLHYVRVDDASAVCCGCGPPAGRVLILILIWQMIHRLDSCCVLDI